MSSIRLLIGFLNQIKSLLETWVQINDSSFSDYQTYEKQDRKQLLVSSKVYRVHKIELIYLIMISIL
ncbi:hypothetical protein [Ancylomarina sp. 16SWW S1-10-2]|uniref:hypothetical protein n=1 Tax=Ancylomarina sp. 16SWW S1-10-2 TaxID=2499681 RepID=UPI0012AE3637|nr:hypothetical protein [Ancylomarina sp. 16SWW S1-10-2]MRT94658.1 hypothetical protein [Ancylomarina sp. 16SWW S1-10-2]